MFAYFLTRQLNALVTAQPKICHRLYAPLLFAHSSSFGAAPSLLLHQWRSFESVVTDRTYLHIPFQSMFAYFLTSQLNALVTAQPKICHRLYAPLLFAHSSSFGAAPSLLLHQWRSFESVVTDRTYLHIPFQSMFAYFLTRQLNALVTAQPKICHRLYAPLLFAHSSSFGAAPSLLLHQWRSFESVVTDRTYLHVPFQSMFAYFLTRQLNALVTAQPKICHRLYAPLLAQIHLHGRCHASVVRCWERMQFCATECRQESITRCSNLSVPPAGGSSSLHGSIWAWWMEQYIHILSFTDASI